MNNKQNQMEPLTADNVGERLLSMKEAAVFLNVSYRTVIRFLRSGELKSFKVGVQTMFSKERHLVAYLKEREQ